MNESDGCGGCLLKAGTLLGALTFFVGLICGYAGWRADVSPREQTLFLLQGLAVSGDATWDRDRERMWVDLTLAGSLHGHLRGTWDTRAVGAAAVLRGAVGGHRVRLRFPAP